MEYFLGLMADRIVHAIVEYHFRAETTRMRNSLARFNSPIQHSRLKNSESRNAFDGTKIRGHPSRLRKNKNCRRNGLISSLFLSSHPSLSWHGCSLFISGFYGCRRRPVLPLLPPPPTPARFPVHERPFLMDSPKTDVLVPSGQAKGSNSFKRNCIWSVPSVR